MNASDLIDGSRIMQELCGPDENVGLTWGQAGALFREQVIAARAAAGPSLLRQTVFGISPLMAQLPDPELVQQMGRVLD